jgi:uncharacterized protein
MTMMIHAFTCRNFYSFGEETTVNFTVNDNAPANNGYFRPKSGVRLSKAETVVGPNASGKTNLLKVLPFLKWLITDSFQANPEALLPVKPFVFGRSEKEPAELSVVFEISGKVYTYAFTLTQERIVSEELKLTSFAKEKKSSKKLFARHWDPKKKSYALSGTAFDLPKGFENVLRANASVISTTARLNHRESRTIADIWQRLETNVVEAGWVGGHLMQNPIKQLSEVLDFYHENTVLKQEAEKLLGRFDLGFSTFEIKKEKTENGYSLETRVLHEIKGEKYHLNLHYESSGTKQLFVLLKSILAALAHGNIAVIDEFDVNLHPEMVLALFDLFMQPETNPRNAQLLFSTHSHMIINKLDKYQLILVEKDEYGLSEAWRLDEVSGVRSDENYYAKYIAGAYGAVPDLT